MDCDEAMQELRRMSLDEKMKYFCTATDNAKFAEIDRAVADSRFEKIWKSRIRDAFTKLYNTIDKGLGC